MSTPHGSEVKHRNQLPGDDYEYSPPGGQTAALIKAPLSQACHNLFPPSGEIMADIFS
jgi:hypothetical protein